MFCFYEQIPSFFSVSLCVFSVSSVAENVKLWQMLLQISTTHSPATDLGYLLAKNPDKAQSFDLSFGRAHAFYPVASETQCDFALLLEVDPIALVRGKNKNDSGPLAQYVNDRPYVAGSFASVAIAQVLRSALSGQSRERPELAASALDFVARVNAIPCSGDGSFARSLFDPLGYHVELDIPQLDPQFGWGNAPCAALTLHGHVKLSDLLAHLYVLLPVLDDSKHYFIGEAEVEKLLKRGAGWLENHPQRDLIVARYLKRQRKLINSANAMLERLAPDADETDAPDAEEERIEKPLSLHQLRLDAVTDELKKSGAKTVLDLGCGEGRLLRALLDERQFETIIGVDASHRALDVAADKLKLERMAPLKRERLTLLHGALTYRDDRLKNFDAAALVEVVEHLDPARLPAFEKAIWQWARPATVVLTTPNREYNAHWASLPAGKMRHKDHRFEWTRAEFAQWAQRVAEENGYSVEIRPLGPEDENWGAPSQMAVFRR